MIDREAIAELYGELLFLDGCEFDAAILGVAQRLDGLLVVAYDTELVLSVLQQDMSPEDALEFFEFNVAGSWLGPQTPMFVDRLPQ